MYLSISSCICINFANNHFITFIYIYIYFRGFWALWIEIKVRNDLCCRLIMVHMSVDQTTRTVVCRRLLKWSRGIHMQREGGLKTSLLHVSTSDTVRYDIRLRGLGWTQHLGCIVRHMSLICECRTRMLSILELKITAGSVWLAVVIAHELGRKPCAGWRVRDYP